MPNTSPLAAGSVVENRYRILHELGHGGFGRTYLAKDTHRFNERCVLKEFNPQIQGISQWGKAEELFQREAKMLYRLQHPQIPCFRELIRVGGNNSLFLVQNYIEGQTYWQLLKQEQRFDESAVTQLLLQLLPVLEYIHSQNVIHRDISPDNLIQRDSDGKPVLIDFGCVKQVAATALSQFTRQRCGTTIGKEGYSPYEQLYQGKAYPCSDLYALAVTVLVLLTGKLPQDIYDSSNATWHWRRLVNLSPTLRAVLDKMLAHRACDRYQSAREVRKALQSGRLNLSNLPTQVVASDNPHLPTPPSNNSRKFGFWRVAVISVSVALLTGVGAFSVVRSYLGQPNSPITTLLSQTQQERQAKIVKRLKALQVNEGVFYQKVDDLFYTQHPEFEGNQLTNAPEHARARAEWYQIAEELLKQLEQGEQI